jgi:hypothetical protein
MLLARKKNQLFKMHSKNLQLTLLQSQPHPKIQELLKLLTLKAVPQSPRPQKASHIKKKVLLPAKTALH